jgi:hypothetical protein
VNHKEYTFPILLLLCDEVRLSLCGTAAANGPIVHPPDDTVKVHLSGTLGEWGVPIDRFCR